MIKFITGKDTLPVRSTILRNNLDTELCHFEGDERENTFHLGYFDHENLICVATFHSHNREGFEGNGYQLRGMATLSQYQGKGIGNQVLNFAIVYLRSLKVNYLWCNARKKAYRFYQSLGFEFISEEFIIEDIGTHRSMYLKIQ
jgi:ribosomal protein S18 acetylase RimI-like enzyme